SWLSAKWPSLSQTSDAVLRAVVTAPGGLALFDDELCAAVAHEVGEVMRASTPPLSVQLRRWGHALPVYAPGHVGRVDRIERALPARVAVAGASYRGLGVPDCIESGRRAAAGVLES